MTGAKAPFSGVRQRYLAEGFLEGHPRACIFESPGPSYRRRSNAILGVFSFRFRASRVWVERVVFLDLPFQISFFPSPRIAGTHLADYKKAWQKAAKAAGLADRRIYDLRAT